MNTVNKFLVIVLVLITITGCGSSKMGQDQSKVTLSLTADKQFVTTSTKFVGTWVASNNSSVTKYVINSDGTVLITAADGSQSLEQLVVSDEDDYFYTDSKTHELIYLQMDNDVLTVFKDADDIIPLKKI